MDTTLNICDHCGTPGQPYSYHGESFSGLHANRGERLCPRCLQVAIDTDGANITVRTRSFTEYTVNTVRDADKVFVGSCELDIADGRDLDKECRRIVRAAKQGKRKKTS
jgi:recombinational DNA repair protein (RecF pathway)